MQKKLFFVTGNRNKFLEAREIISDLVQINLDLKEIQEIDAHRIIEEKLKEARKHAAGCFIVEDTSLYLSCLKGLPGPLIKWFIETIGNEGLYNIAKSFKNFDAKAKTVIGYCNKQGKIYFFESCAEGKIVKPTTKKSFGWDNIFKPSGYKKTFAEMSLEEKTKISMRARALRKLKIFLEKEHGNIRNSNTFSFYLPKR